MILQFERIALQSIARNSATESRDKYLDTLRRLKTMLDEKLIKQSECDAKMVEIMERM